MNDICYNFINTMHFLTFVVCRRKMQEIIHKKIKEHKNLCSFVFTENLKKVLVHNFLFKNDETNLNKIKFVLS